VVLERLGKVLEAAGSSLAQAVSVSVFLKEAGDFEAMNTVYRGFLANAPPTRTTVITQLPPRAQVAMSAIAVLKGQSREVLHPAGWMKSPRPYSYIVRAGNLVFLSGLVSRRGTDDQAVPGPMSTQVKTILDNAGVLLRTAGLTLGDVVASRVFIVDESTFTEMNDEYRRFFAVDPPARATAIAGLVGSSSLVEITLIAAADGRQTIGPSVSPSLPLSPAVRAGRFVFLSGVLGNTDQNQHDVAQQTREVFDRIRRTLDTAGLSFSDVIDNTVYVTDLSKTAAVDQVSLQFFPSDAPARSLVGTRLVARTGLVEMMMTAWK
jgi:2-iminobutanoate/2-iminopropanoate deaminase